VSTTKLCRQLKDNPDVGGNQKLIKGYKTDLCMISEEMMKFMAENQSFSEFKSIVDKAIVKYEEFDNLRDEEQKLNAEIKKISEDLKKKQDNFAKEAQESSDDIQKLKKQVNECKTESELQI
jgi:multidrug resistance efflux pump